MSAQRRPLDKRAILDALESGALTAAQARELLAWLEKGAEFKRGRPRGPRDARVDACASTPAKSPVYIELVGEALCRHAEGVPMGKANQRAIAEWLRGERKLVRVRHGLTAHWQDPRSYFARLETFEAVRRILRELRGLPSRWKVDRDGRMHWLEGRVDDGIWRGTNVTTIERRRAIAILKQREPELYQRWCSIVRALARIGRRKEDKTLAELPAPKRRATASGGWDALISTVLGSAISKGAEADLLDRAASSSSKRFRKITGKRGRVVRGYTSANDIVAEVRARKPRKS